MVGKIIKVGIPQLQTPLLRIYIYVFGYLGAAKGVGRRAGLSMSGAAAGPSSGPQCEWHKAQMRRALRCKSSDLDP